MEALGYERRRNPGIKLLAYVLGLQPRQIFTFRPLVGQNMEGFARDARVCAEKAGVTLSDIAAWPVHWKSSDERERDEESERAEDLQDSSCSSHSRVSSSIQTSTICSSSNSSSSSSSNDSRSVFSMPATPPQHASHSWLTSPECSPSQPSLSPRNVSSSTSTPSSLSSSSNKVAADEAHILRWSRGLPSGWHLHGGGRHVRRSSRLSTGEQRGEPANAGPYGAFWHSSSSSSGSTVMGTGLGDGIPLIGEVSHAPQVLDQPGAWLHRRPFHPFKPDRGLAQAKKAARRARRNGHRGNGNGNSDLHSVELQMNGLIMTLEEIDLDDFDDTDDDDDDDDDSSGGNGGSEGGSGFQK